MVSDGICDACREPATVKVEAWIGHPAPWNGSLCEKHAIELRDNGELITVFGTYAFDNGPRLQLELRT